MMTLFRILRGIRFAITKNLSIEYETYEAMKDYNYSLKMPVVSEERIREELYKCFKADTPRTIHFLDSIPELKNYIFNKTNLWLKPTSEK